jgi:hypothetical protein
VSGEELYNKLFIEQEGSSLNDMSMIIGIGPNRAKAGESGQKRAKTALAPPTSMQHCTLPLLSNDRLRRNKFTNILAKPLRQNICKLIYYYYVYVIATEKNPSSNMCCSLYDHFRTKCPLSPPLKRPEFGRLIVDSMFNIVPND